MGDLYARLLMSPVASVVAHGLGFEGTRQAIRAVLAARAEDVPQAPAILAQIEAAKALYDDRNSVVHAAVWYSGSIIGPVLSTVHRS